MNAVSYAHWIIFHEAYQKLPWSKRYGTQIVIACYAEMILVAIKAAQP